MTTIHRLSCPHHPDHHNHRWPKDCPCVGAADKPADNPADNPAEEAPAWDGDTWASHLAMLELSGIRRPLVLGPYQALMIASLLDFTRQNSEDDDTRDQLVEMVKFVIEPFRDVNVNGMSLVDILRKTVDAEVIVH